MKKNNPFYQSSTRELKQLEKEAYETFTKALSKFTRLEDAIKFKENVLTNGNIICIISTKYQVERIEVITKGIERAFKDYMESKKV